MRTTWQSATVHQAECPSCMARAPMAANADAALRMAELVGWEKDGLCPFCHDIVYRLRRLREVAERINHAPAARTGRAAAKAKPAKTDSGSKDQPASIQAGSALSPTTGSKA